MAKHKRRIENISIPLTKEDFPLETLKQFIEENLISEEIPFELIAEQYPSLLDEWYPGYPGELRKVTPDDPIPLVGFIKNGAVSFKDIPMLGSVPLDMEIDPLLEGEYKVWLKKDKDSFSIHIVVDE